MKEDFKVIKRTFNGSKDNAGTSPYMTSHKYAVIGQGFSSTYRTKKDALEAIKRMSKN